MSVKRDEKELKKLEKHLVLAIDWTAAEFKYLEEFKEEIEKLKKDDKPRKRMRKAAHFLRYIGRSERRAFHFQNFVGKELHEIYDELVASKAGFSSKIKAVIESVRIVAKELDVEMYYLAKNASEHIGRLERDLDGAYRHMGKEQKNYLQLVKQTEQNIGDLETWIGGIEVSLKKAQELLPELNQAIITREGLNLLKMKSWPLPNDHPATQFLAQRPADLLHIISVTRDYAANLFIDLEKAANVIVEKPWTWPGMVKMIEYNRQNAYQLFRTGFEHIEDIITPETWPGLIKLVKISQQHSGYMFAVGIPYVKKFITKRNWPLIVDGFIKMSRGDDSQLWQHHYSKSLSVVEHIITVKNWPKIASNLVRLPYTAIDSIFPSMKELITIESLPIIVDGLVEFDKAFDKYKQGSSSRHFINYRNGGYAALSKVGGTYTIESWPTVVKIFIEFVEKEVHSMDKFAKTFQILHDYLSPELWGVIEKVPKNERDRFILYSLVPMKEMLTPQYFPGLTKIIQNLDSTVVYNLFKYGIPAVKDLITPKTWPIIVEEFIEISKMGNIEAKYFFEHILVQMPHLIHKKNWLPYLDGIIKINEAEGKEKFILQYALKGVKTLITPKTWPELVNNLIKLAKMSDAFKGRESEVYHSLDYLTPLFIKFENQLFDLLIFPTIKRQQMSSSKIFNSFLRLDEMFKREEDFTLLISIMNKRKLKTNDFIKEILIIGRKRLFIYAPLSHQKENLLSFVDNCSVDFIEVYQEYISLLHSDHPEKAKHMEMFVKKYKQIKQDIFSGVLSQDFDEKILVGIIYSVFAPEISIDRSTYYRTYSSRTDRQADIPNKLWHGLTKISPYEVKISKGGVALKAGEELRDEAWHNLVEAVAEINTKPVTVIPQQLGLDLLKAFVTKSLKDEKKKYVKLLYAFSVQLGEALPEFNTSHITLMKYKEFVGDRLRNDLILKVVSEAHEKEPGEFTKIIQLIGKPKKFDGLAKQLHKMWTSAMPDKITRIKAVLERNRIHVDNLNWTITNWQDIRGWLHAQSANTLSKKVINDIFAMLTGENYNQMIHEMDKFEHSHKATGKGGEKYLFMLSKRKLHSVAMYNMGVCVASDDRMWNMPDFWPMIIWDKNFHAHGGVMFRTIEEAGKKYLVLSINPSSSILNQVSPVHLYDQIIAYAEKIRKKLHYDQILIPTNGAIHSNRGSIQAAITERSYPKKTLSSKHVFSYSPHAYTYQEFFIVG